MTKYSTTQQCLTTKGLYKTHEENLAPALAIETFSGYLSLKRPGRMAVAWRSDRDGRLKVAVNLV
jgi:hypothetical protein